MWNGNIKVLRRDFYYSVTNCIEIKKVNICWNINQLWPFFSAPFHGKNENDVSMAYSFWKLIYILFISFDCFHFVSSNLFYCIFGIICCKPYPLFARITWFAWQFDAHWVIAMAIPIRHGYFVFRVDLWPRIMQSAQDIVPLVQSLISIVAWITSWNEPCYYYGFFARLAPLAWWPTVTRRGGNLYARRFSQQAA